jgi:hypothetical protein
MDKAKLKGLQRLKESLILAAEDMDQANAAAIGLRSGTSDDANFRWALETAIAVCYMRPFTYGVWKLPNRYLPKASPEAEIHKGPRQLRNKAYAHSDR